MSATMVADPTRTRQLIAYVNDRKKKRLQERAQQYHAAALARQAATREFYEWLDAQRTPEALAKQQQITTEIVALFALARKANERLIAYIRAHPYESY